MIKFYRHSTWHLKEKQNGFQKTKLGFHKMQFSFEFCSYGTVEPMLICNPVNVKREFGDFFCDYRPVLWTLFCALNSYNYFVLRFMKLLRAFAGLSNVLLLYVHQLLWLKMPFKLFLNMSSLNLAVLLSYKNTNPKTLWVNFIIFRYILGGRTFRGMFQNYFRAFALMKSS